MLRLDIAELERRDRVSIEGELPGDLPLWDETGFRFPEPVRVHLVAQATTSGEILVRGTIEAVLETECRRCLQPVQVKLDEEVAILFAPPDQLTPEDQGGEIRLLDLEGNVLDLSEAVREELVLAAPRWVECDPGCKGLCPRCGVNRNEEECDCSVEELDPRWAALRNLTLE